MTEVGETPSTGGRIRQYATDAERTRAWRERRKLDRETAGRSPLAAAATEGQSPELAVASLASVIPALREALAAAEARIAEQVALVEDAVALLSDPDAIDERLEAARVGAARQVADAQATEQAARADAARARRAEQAAHAQAEDAAAAADAATAENTRLEEELAALRTVNADLQARLEQATGGAEQARTDLTAALDREQALTGEVAAAARQHDTDLTAIADLTASTVQLTGDLAAQTARADASEQTIRRLENDLTSTRGQLDAARTAAQTQHDADAARITELTADLRGLTTERDQLTARLTDTTTRAEAERQRLQEAADRRVAEIRDLLAQQITQLQRDRQPDQDPTDDT